MSEPDQIYVATHHVTKVLRQRQTFLGGIGGKFETTTLFCYSEGVLVLEVCLFHEQPLEIVDGEPE